MVLPINDALADLRAIKLPFNLDEVKEECHNCVRKQLKKYEKMKDSHGKSMKGQFIVPCRGIPSNPVDPDLLAMLPNQETRDEMEELQDIVKWASKNLKLADGSPWNARWYQANVLRCTARRKVLRISRRAGKCISSDSEILTENGLISAEKYFSLQKKPRVVSFNQDTQTTTFANAFISNNGKKTVFSLKTKNGRETEATGNHPFLIRTSENNAKWKELEDLAIGDSIAVPSSYSHLDIKGIEVGAKKSRLLGYLTGDGGTSHKTTVRFSNADKEILDDLSDIISDFKCKLNYIGQYDYNIVGDLNNYGKFKSNKINKIVTENGLRCLAKHKTIPKCILEGSKEDITNFLGAYWDCDGWISIKLKPDKGHNSLKGEIGICSASKKLMLETKHLLLRLGIHSSLVHKKVKYKNKLNDAWQISFSNKDGIIKFYNNISLKAKQDKLEDIYNLVKDRKAVINTKNNYFWDKVKEIKELGLKQTYDLSVPGMQTFVADDIISHNTDSVCVEICYYLFTHPGIKLVVAGPQKTHAEEIFNRVREFIASNPILHNMVVRDVSAPWYEIILTNGARLRGFAAGAKGKGSAVGIRGQDADRLYLEEMDYVDQNAITGAVLPILQTTPNTALVGFSTPSGFRTPYYECCEEDPQYVEFHFTYKVLPHWKAVERDKPRFTEERWTHEFLAEWGSSEDGVYKPEYIDAALTAYDYSDIKRNSSWRYCIGTDWNEKYGTEIVVIGYNTSTNLYQIVDAVLVSGSEFTQLSGIAKLLELNRKWKPNYIYIDAGNGSTNYELLRKTSFEERRPDGDRDTARLLDILKRYDAGSSIPTKDPVTGSDIRMPAKAFMINASVRMFEQKKIKISSYDDLLERQMRSYIIERYTPTKTPVYGLNDKKAGDHRLDAMNLALVAFHLEFDDLHVVTYLTDVAAIPDPRTMSQTINHRPTHVSDRQSRPEDRRLEGPVESSSAFGVLPAKVDFGYQKVKTDRRGWDFDKEEEEKGRYLQRKRSRGTVQRNRPTRSTF